jgi:hypothetical protein
MSQWTDVHHASRCRGRRMLLFGAVVGLVAGWVSGIPSAVGSPRALWVGTDNTSNRLMLKIDLSGVLLNTVGPIEVTGIACDPVGNRLYVSSDFNLVRTFTADSMNEIGSFYYSPRCSNLMEDAAFDGQNIWAICYGAGTVNRVDPATGHIAFSFQPFNPELDVPLGVAFDGSGLWVSGIYGKLVKRFDLNGTPTGEEWVFGGSHFPGGLAYDACDSSLYVGTVGEIWHYSRAGVLLGTIAVPVFDGRFVDGLELVGDECGTASVRPGAEAALALDGVLPNPTREGAFRVRFTLTTSSAATLELLDVSGRRMFVRDVGSLGAGRHELDPTNGRRLTPGIYLVRLRQGATERVTRVTILK